MSSVLFSLPAAPVASPSSTSASQASSSSTASSARGRDASQSPDADGFGAALARMHEARRRQQGDKADGDAQAGTTAPVSRRRAPADSEQNATSPADLLAMAMLTPAFNIQAAAQKLRGGTASDGAVPVDIARSAALPQQDVGEVSAEASTAVGAQQADEVQTDKPVATAPKARADKDAKAADDDGIATRKSDALTLPDAKVATPATTTTAGTATNAAPTAPLAPSATADAKPAANAAAKSLAVDAKTAAADPKAAALRAEEPSLADSGDAKSDAATIPAAMAFKTALAQATDTGATTQQAQSLPRYDVNTPVGTDAWGNDIGTQMIRMSTDGKQVAELNLNPAGLGPLKVTLTLGDNQAQAMFVSAHESVRRAVEAALPQLRDTLANQGIQLGQASVDAGAQQQQQQAFGQEQRGFDSPAPRNTGNGRDGSRTTAEAPQDIQPSAPASRAPRSAIDTFA